MTPPDDMLTGGALSDALRAGQVAVDIRRDSVVATLAATLTRDLEDAPTEALLARAAGQGRAAILDQAREAVTKDRAATHGAVEASFAAIAAIWSVRLGVTVTPAQVAILMVDLKTVRAWGNPGHGDNWVDMAGYAACGGELAGGAA